MFRYYYITPLIILFAVGCGTSQNPTLINSTAETISKNVQPNNETTFYLFGSPELPKGLSIQEYQKMFREYINQKRKMPPEHERVEEFQRKIVKTVSWQDAHKEAKSCIDDTEGKFFATDSRQLIAASMLRQYFTTLYPSPDVQAAAAYYVNVLINYQNFTEINLMAKILPLLTGYWAQEKIAELAGQYIKEYYKSYSYKKRFNLDEFFQERAKQEIVKSSAGTASSESVKLLSKELRQKYWKEVVTNFSGNKSAKEYHSLKDIPSDYQPTPDTFAVLSLLIEQQNQK